MIIRKTNTGTYVIERNDDLWSAETLEQVFSVMLLCYENRLPNGEAEKFGTVTINRGDA